MRLITALARLRRWFGVTSGINATAGERYSPMDTRVKNSTARKITWLLKDSPVFHLAFSALSIIGSNIMKITARIVPATIKGILLPSFVCTLSDSAPNTGSRKIANTLSNAMTAPVMVSPR